MYFQQLRTKKQEETFIINTSGRILNLKKALFRRKVFGKNTFQRNSMKH